MYQFNLAKDLKEHKKTFPLSLKFTTDLMSVTELFASGRLVVLLHVSKTVGLSNSRPLSLLTLKLYCIIQSVLLDMTIPFKWITSLLSRRQTYSSWFLEDKLTPHDFFQKTFIVKEGTMPAVTIQFYEQRLNFFSIWSYHWHQLFLIDQHQFHPFATTPWCFLEPPLLLFSPRGSIWPNLRFHGWTCNSHLINQHSPSPWP